MQDKARSGWSPSCGVVVPPECEVMMKITPPSWCPALGSVVLELVGIPGKSLTRDAMRRL